MQNKNNSVNNFVKTFAKIRAIINLIAIGYFIEAICHSIFEHSQGINSKKREVWSFICTYIGEIKTKS